MSRFARLLFAVACAALLLIGSEARSHHRRTSRRQNNFKGKPDTSVALGTIRGTNIITLPVIHLSGPDVIVGFPDNCAGEDLILQGTQLIVSNSDGGLAVDLIPDDANDPLSNVAIHCLGEHGIFRCTEGVDVKSYQYCRERIG